MYSRGDTMKEDRQANICHSRALPHSLQSSLHTEDGVIRIVFLALPLWDQSVKLRTIVFHCSSNSSPVVLLTKKQSFGLLFCFLTSSTKRWVGWKGVFHPGGRFQHILISTFYN